MRGADQPQTAMFSYLAVEDRIPADHPLRAISALIQPILTALSPRFDGLYARMGRPSIHRNACCARCCCRFSIRSAASGS